MNTLLFDSRDPRCKTPFGALPTQDVATFHIFLPIAHHLSAPVLLMYQADRWDTPERFPMRLKDSDGICCSYSCIFYAQDPQLYFTALRCKAPMGSCISAGISRDLEAFPGNLEPCGSLPYMIGKWKPRTL